MDFTSLVEARSALDTLWEEGAWLHGRCWGPVGERRGAENPYARTNITIAVGKELVSITQNKDGTLTIHEFMRTTEETLLGRGVRIILRRAGLPLAL